MTQRRLALSLAAAALAAVPATATATDAPAAWLPTHANVTITGSRIAAFPDGTGYVTGFTNPGVVGVPLGRHQTLHRTTDYGRTWTPVLPGVPAGIGFPTVVFTAPTTGWAYDGASSFARTTDGGVSWTAGAATLPLGAAEVVETPFGDGVSGSRAGGALAVGGHVVDKAAGGPCLGRTGDAVFWTTDGGATWAERRFPAYGSPGAVRIDAVEAADADRGVLLAWSNLYDCFNSANTGYDVYVTDDAGATWTRVAASPATGPGIGAATIDGNTIAVGYDDGTVRVSTDGGATFATTRRLESGTEIDARPHAYVVGEDQILDLAFRGPTGYATQNSGLVWRTTNGGVTWQVDGIAAPGDLALFDADRAVVNSLATVTTRIP